MATEPFRLSVIRTRSHPISENRTPSALACRTDGAESLDGNGEALTAPGS